MKKVWIVGALLVCLSGSAVMAAAPADFTNMSQYAMVQGARKNDRGAFQNALYLDMNSVHVVDVADDGMIVTADVLEVPEKGSVTKHSTKYKLGEDGKESILGLDGNWYVLPENSDDPAAVAAMKVRDELGNSDKREQFVTEIQHILLKKQAGNGSGESAGASATTPERAEGNPAPAVQVEPAADGATPAEQETLPEAAADAYAKSSAVRPKPDKQADSSQAASAADESEKAKDPDTQDNGSGDGEPSADTAEPKDTVPTKKEAEPADPPVMVQIESHQPPQVKVEIKGHGE